MILVQAGNSDYLEVKKAMVHDALQQLICGSIAGGTHKDAGFASQVRQCAAQAGLGTCL